MEHEEIQQRVRHVFERQGLETEVEGTEFKAHSKENSISGRLFSSEKHTESEVIEAAEGKVFVDEGLSEVSEHLDNVSVLKEDSGSSVEMPSFEIIGDIAVINHLEMDRQEAVKSILIHHDVKTVLLKTEPLQGEFRVGEYKVLYGGETQTIHRENGCRFKVDVTEAYFSERLATERKRVLDDVSEGEEVLVVGAGVGPYPIEIASDTGVQEVLAVEKNPKAIDMMRDNISMNDVSDLVNCVEGDIRNIDVSRNFERVIAAAPAADEIRQPVMDLVAGGGTLQYYTFAQDEDNGGKQFAEVDRDFTLAETTSCGEIGPSASRVCARFERC